MRKQLIVIVVLVAALSASIGYGLGAATSPPAANAASASQSSEVVDQLRAINAKLGRRQTSRGSVRGLLTIICDYTASISCTP
ncbi:MAG TPA: hypothetical protein VFM57_12115 [Thermoleophilaceae bacterium]|nr:hypothetical protein [Thermoleophilaceae bacterium]